MVEDDQIPESGKSARKRDRSVVDRDRRRVLGGADLDAVATPPSRLSGRTGGGRFPRPASRARRGTAATAGGWLGGGRAGRQIAQRDLQLLLGRLQLAGELRVQVAPPIDVADQFVP